MYKVEDNIVYL